MCRKYSSALCELDFFAEALAQFRPVVDGSLLDVIARSLRAKDGGEQRLVIFASKSDDVESFVTAFFGGKHCALDLGEPDVALKSGIGRDGGQPFFWGEPKVLKGADGLEDGSIPNDNEATGSEKLQIPEKVLDREGGASDSGPRT